MKNQSRMSFTKKASISQKSSKNRNLIFIAGLAVSCVGEILMINYLIISPNVLTVEFIVGLILVTLGNVTMLKEHQLQNLTIGF